MSLNLDLSGVTEQGSPIPDGTYSVVVEKAEVAETRSGGTMVKVQLKIKEGAANGRSVFDQFNIVNANPQAVQIGLGQLKGFMKSFGHANPNKLTSTTELVGLKGFVTVKTEDDTQYGPQTRVKAYKPLGPVTGADVAKTPGTNTGVAAKSNPFG